MLYFLVFLAGMAIDFAYAVYVRACVARRAWRASIASVLMAAPALFGYLAIIENHYLAASYLGGLGVGTFIAVRWGK